jgi:iron-sulfur cluster repair protein YtfE (RIC family)
MEALEGGSTVAIQIGAKPDSGFDDPIGMLKDCHRRIEQFLHILWLVAERAVGRVLTDEETAGVQAALRYFREGGQRHTADEEESLFPRLRAETSPQDLQEIGSLEDDHSRASELHAAVETLYVAWISAGLLSPEEGQRLRAGTEQLKHLYEEHIQLEEKIVFPHAAQTLDNRTIAAIGQEFRARRG